MTNEEAIKLISMIDVCDFELHTNTHWGSFDDDMKEALSIAIKSLEAWEIIKDNLSQQVHHNLDVKEKFEIGSVSRIECDTTTSVLAGVIYLIDRYLAEVEHNE